MLCHFRSRGRRHQRRARGDVEGQRAPAAGADHVYQFIALSGSQRQNGRPLAHHIDKAGQLRRQFAARGQNREQRRGLHLRHAAGQDFFESMGRLLPRQRRAVLGQRLQKFL